MPRACASAIVCARWNPDDHRRDARRGARHAPPPRRPVGRRRGRPRAGSLRARRAARAPCRSGRCDAVIALGAIVRGETTHHEVLGHAVAGALAAPAVETGVPIGFGLLTCDTMEQARAAHRQGRRGGRGRDRDGQPPAPPEEDARVGARRKARELALQMLYENDVAGTEPQRDVPPLGGPAERARRASATSRERLVSRNADAPGRTSTRSSRGRRTTGGSRGCRSWTATSCGSPSSSCCTSPTTPRPVVIDEALEIAKRFSTPRSRRSSSTESSTAS